jgi:serine/threonine protein kinase
MTATQCPSCKIELPPNSPGGLCPNCLLGNVLDSNPDAFDRAPFAATSPGPGRAAPPEIDALADLFPELGLQGLLGHGGMGAVYKARQKKLDREIALKIIRPEAAGDPSFTERFMREARTLARLNHPNIVSIHDFGDVTSDSDDQTLYYFVMEYVDGANLRQLMQDGGLKGSLPLSVVSQICEALQYAHDEGIVHRDIKPENILIDSRGRVKIADFGLAKLAVQSGADFTLTGTHQVMGTPRYMAPEQMQGSRSVDHRADIYSLGVVFYEMLTGQIPAGHFEPPSKQAEVDDRLDDVVLRAMASDPNDRFQNISELRSDIEQIASGDLPAVPRPDSSPSEPPAGFSTILDREAAAAWNLFAGTSPQRQPGGTPQLPALLMLLLSICGCATVFLPWVEFQMLSSNQTIAEGLARANPESRNVDNGVTFRADEYLICQDAESPFIAQSDSSETTWSGSIPTVAPGDVVVFSGTDKWPGIAAASCFAMMAFLLIIIPRRIQPHLAVATLLTATSILAMVHIMLFQIEAKSSTVYFQETTTANLAGIDLANNARYQVCLLQDAEAASEPDSHSLAHFPHRIEYRNGYYLVIGLSIVLLVMNGLSIRQAVAAYSSAAASASPARVVGTGATDGPVHPGRSITTIRFQTKRPAAMKEMLQFHFEGLGYQLTAAKSNEWVFKRGTRLAGLWSMNVRDIETTLMVRVISVGDDDILVNCEWKLVTLGAAVTKSDIRKLEADGRQLQDLLRPASPLDSDLGSPQPASTDTTEATRLIHQTDSRVGHSTAAPSLPRRALLAAGLAAPVGTTPYDRLWNSGDSAARDVLFKLRTASSLMTFSAILGGLNSVIFGLWVFFPYLFFGVNRFLDFKLMVLVVAGVTIGLSIATVVICSAQHLRAVRRYEFCFVGCILTLLPWSGIAWIVAFPTGVWMFHLLQRDDVRTLFLQGESIDHHAG